MIERNLNNLFKDFPETNPFGEKVTLVAAVKTRTVEEINRAVAAGIEVIGDNHAQEVRDKYELICGNPQRHFIGHLQTNKLKYLIGKIDLYHSLDRISLAEELDKRSAAAGIVSHALVQINVGNEESKSGFEYGAAAEACRTLCNMRNLQIDGLMAMLPESDDEKLLRSLAKKMREKYDELRAIYPAFKYLSMGMSGDWRLCVECGSNMVRLGTAIFGKRNA